MNKKVLIFLIGLSTTSFSQSIQGKFILGLNAAQVDGDRSFGFNRIGPLVGGAANMPVGKKIFFQPEVVYSMRGAGASQNIFTPLSILHYVDVPLLIYYQMFPKWSLQGGITWGYLLNAQLDRGFGYDNITKDLKKYDIAFSVGAEYAFSKEWALNIRYNYSAVPINDNASLNNILWFGGWFNNYLSISFRYIFIDRAK